MLKYTVVRDLLRFTLFVVLALCCGCGGGSGPTALVAAPAQPTSGPLPPPPQPPPPPPPPPQPSGQGSTSTPAATVSLKAEPTTVVPGQLTTLTWTTTNATSITIDPALPLSEGQQLTLPSGTATLQVQQTTTYVATVKDATGKAADSRVTVTVIPVQFDLSAQPDTIQSGESATLSWSTQGVTGLFIDNGVGDMSSKLPRGSVTVSPAADTTYTATATVQGGGTVVKKVVVSVAPPPVPTGNPIKHIIFMLQENRTFDNYFGRLGKYRANRIPGASDDDVDGFDPNVALRTKTGKQVRPYHYQTVCTEGITFGWNESHNDLDLQAPATFMDTDFSKASFLMDAFAKNVNLTTKDPDGTRQMGFYNETDLPYYYELATQFATSDRFFSSVLSNTIPNRMYMFTGTSFGHVKADSPPATGWAQRTIFRALNDAGVSWRYYYQDQDVYFSDFADYRQDVIKAKVYNISNWFDVLSSATADQDLPQVVFIERAGSTGLDEHPENNIQSGSATVKKIIDALMKSDAWKSSVFILTYDEGGGLYDHVPPFQVPAPDAIAPMLQGGDVKGRFNLSGMRIPITVISPWVKPHFVSHESRELTSILKFIETRFNVAPLTKRDAAADDMSEFFDFTKASWLTPPSLPAQPTAGTCDQSLESGPTF